MSDRVIVPFGKADADVLEVSVLGGWVSAIHIEDSDEPLRSVFNLSDIQPLIGLKLNTADARTD